MICPKEFTQHVILDSVEYTLDLMVSPDTDISTTFKGWCNDENEMLTVNGWMFS